MDRLREVFDVRFEGKLAFSLEQTQLAGACYCFGAPLDLEFIEDDPTVPLNRAQGEEQPLANLTIRKSLGNESQYFQLALAERLDEGLRCFGSDLEGEAKSGDINGFVKDLANREMIYPELKELFGRFHQNIQIAYVEKVLVQRADQLPYYDLLKAQGVQASEKLPFDCMTWFAIAAQ